MKELKDKSKVFRHGIELVRPKIQEMELKKMAVNYSTDLDFIQTGKKGIALQCKSLCI